ncbi:hypothetical protein CBP35_19945 (plasmid) [Acidovorax carolinensis]|uniref:Hpt domain-containing protein n=1 Tax=Acidovorax carolinensis TaxID=553814 RepID=UPI000B620D50|nr:Hpt domain-containing protein [Acidovorax carolinensis]ART57189.1 hypothetical protein CBP35_19945 [Acidovorax carolinensis]
MMVSSAVSSTQSRSASRLQALTTVSEVIFAQLKEIAARLNAFSETPSSLPLSPQLFELTRIANFCGFWGVGNYLGALAELSFGIETVPVTTVDRAEYLERVKTLASGVNALGIHLKGVGSGLSVSYSALNERLSMVLRKARPQLLEMAPAEFAEIMFMVAPPSLEVEARWEPQPGASHESLLKALDSFAESPGADSARAVANVNPHRTLSGLFESVAALWVAGVSGALSSDVVKEYGRLQRVLAQGWPVIPPSPDHFLFSRLLHSIATATEVSGSVAALKQRYSLARPHVSTSGVDAVSMHDVAKKFGVAVSKFKDSYIQSAHANTPAPVAKMAAVLVKEAASLESPAFTSFAEALCRITGDWGSATDLAPDEWIRGASLLLLLQESADSWGNQETQARLNEIAERFQETGNTGPCASMQHTNRIQAIAKGCAALLTDAAELKVSIDGALRSVDTENLTDSQAEKIAEVAGGRTSKLLREIGGFCQSIGLKASIHLADQLVDLARKKESWATHEGRALLFDGLSRVTTLLARLRPSALIDIQTDEMGPFAPQAAEPTIEVPISPEIVRDEDDAVESPAPQAPDLAATDLPAEGDIAPQPAQADGPQLDGFTSAVTAPDEISEAPDEIIETSSETSVLFSGGTVTNIDAIEAMAAVDLDLGLDGFGDFDGADGPSRPRVRKPEIDPKELGRQFLASADGRGNSLDDLDDELLKVMFEESEQCMSAIEANLLKWQEGANNTQLRGTVSEARRHIHTLKGVCRTCGMMGVGAILHLMEDRLEITADDGIDLATDVPAYVVAMVEVRRVIEAERDRFESGGAMPDSSAAAPSEAPQQLPGGDEPVQPGEAVVDRGTGHEATPQAAWPGASRAQLARPAAERVGPHLAMRPLSAFPCTWPRAWAMHQASFLPPAGVQWKRQSAPSVCCGRSRATCSGCTPSFGIWTSLRHQAFLPRSLPRLRVLIRWNWTGIRRCKSWCAASARLMKTRLPPSSFWRMACSMPRGKSRTRRSSAMTCSAKPASFCWWGSRHSGPVSKEWCQRRALIRAKAQNC